MYIFSRCAKRVVDKLQDYWMKKISSLCCVCVDFRKLRIFNVQILYFTQLAILCHQPASVSSGNKILKKTEEKCSFPLAGSLDLDEDGAKASCVYNSRVVAISLGPWF